MRLILLFYPIPYLFEKQNLDFRGIKVNQYFEDIFVVQDLALNIRVFIII